MAAAFGLPLYRSWREGGFEREMLRQDAPTAPILFETPHGLMRAGGAGPRNTRLRFPQVSADLSVRWCSAALKIGVGAATIAGQDRFLGRRTLVVTGERAQESAARARYATFEPHRTDTRGGARRRQGGGVHQSRRLRLRPVRRDQPGTEPHRPGHHPGHRLGGG